MMNFQLYELYELSTFNSPRIPARNAGSEPLLFVRKGPEPRCGQVCVILRESAEGGRPKDPLPRKA